MFTVNEYFDAKVKSLAFENNSGNFTSGVMAPGEYEFATSAKEYMTLIQGEWKIKLPGSDEFVNYPNGSTFEVEANVKFQVVATENTAYLCRYE